MKQMRDDQENNEAFQEASQQAEKVFDEVIKKLIAVDSQEGNSVIAGMCSSLSKNFLLLRPKAMNEETALDALCASIAFYMAQHVIAMENNKTNQVLQ